MFTRGDKVRLTKDSRDIRFPWTFEKGETGVLGRRYRIQDGVEVWELILDKKRPFLSGEITTRIAVQGDSIEQI
jgi:hypothetical protein